MKMFLRWLAFSLFILILLSPIAFASDTNIDGGGGDTGWGDDDFKWSIGEDGVRVTVVKESTKHSVTTPVDFTNKKITVDMFCGYKNKLNYTNNPSLSMMVGSDYKYVNPTSYLPTIVSNSGGSNIEAVRDYFRDVNAIKFIADKTGFDYNQLISGDYVLLLEPLVYITYEGIRFAMTATEAALYDQMVSGELKKKLGSITHQNLPLAMFLEKPDLGYPAWNGATTGLRANSDIISSLGLGTVRFSEGACCNHELNCSCITGGSNDCNCKETHPSTPCDPSDSNCDCKPKEEGDITSPDYTYRTNTEVISSVEIYNNSSEGINPLSPASVTFTIEGKRYTVNDIVIPPNESQLVWVEWKTPKTPKTIQIGVSVSGGATPAKSTITADIVEIKEKTPPNTEGRDRNDGFQLSSLPNFDKSTSHQWGEWWALWKPNWVWESDMDWVSDDCDSSCSENCSGNHGYWEDNGKYVDKGWWEYDYTSYYASLSIVECKLSPDERVPTAKKSGNKWEIKSGYGVNIYLKTNINSDGSSTDITPIQNVLTLFPEFGYQQYNRLLVKDEDIAGTMHEWRFADNPFSQFTNPVHFTPIWYPDKMKFEVLAIPFDAWTPKGQLYSSISDYILIDGNVYDDWHIAPY